MKDLISFVHESILVDVMVDVVVVTGGDTVMDMTVDTVVDAVVDMGKQDELLSRTFQHAVDRRQDRFQFSESARCQDDRPGRSANKESL